MKRLLLFSILSVFCFTISAQTNTWTGSGPNDNWNTVANWSLNAVPTASNNVVIPTGFTVNLNVAGTTKSITVQGNSTFNIASNLSFTNASSFGANTSIVWSSGTLNAAGILTNNGTINMTTNSTKNINGGSIVNNNGTINMSGNFTLYIYSGSLINLATGVIDIQGLPNLAPYTSSDHSIINSGVIKKTTAAGTAVISVALTNTGTIAVESGTLSLGGEVKTFDGGIYNVTAGNTLDLATTINLSDTLTGLVNGNLNWKSNMAVATTASFNFTGSSGINWASGSLIGGGTLTNISKLNMTTNSTKNILDGSILSNSGTLNCLGSFTLYIYEGNLNNLSSGIIDIQALPNLAPYTASSHSIVNSGLIKKTTNAGTAIISVAMTNTGTISVENGTLNFSGEAKTFNGGVYNVTAEKTLDLTTDINLSNTMTGLVNGNLNWKSNILVTTAASFNFTGSAGIKWVSGSLNGGGTLNNTSELNMITNATKNILGNSILMNSGALNCLGNFTLYIYEGVLNNQTDGIVNIQASPNLAPYTSSAHSIINSGLIKKTVGTATATISVALTNTGTIAVESGILNMTGEPKTFNGGTYNVSETSVLNLSTQVICSGDLTGIATGPISWNNYINVVTANPATFNITGTSGINWTSGSLDGGGTLTNAGKMNLTTNATKNILGGSTLSNSGELNCLGNFTLYIYAGILNNQSTGVIDIQSLPAFSPYSTDPHSITNSGLIKKTSNTGVAQINLNLTNSGIINSQLGTLQINGGPFTNTVDGIVSGTASIDLPPVADYTNNGILSPGGNPGTLTVIGDFKSSTTSELQIEIYGATQGTEYDLLAVQGNALFDGSINLLMGFAANVGDEFIVATTTGTITQCSLQPTASGYFDGFVYNFDVICRNDNQVVLTVNSIVLGTQENTLNSIKIYPNPSNGHFTIDLGREYTDVNVQIYNMLGQQISFVNYASTKLIEQEINTSAGIYFVKVSTAKKGSKTLRIIKQ